MYYNDEQSHAVLDEQWAIVDLREAAKEHASVEVIADLDTAAACASVVSLRSRGN